MSWRIDVLDSSGAVLGSGPITSATGWQSTTRMDRAGVFSFEMPASDAALELSAEARTRSPNFVRVSSHARIAQAIGATTSTDN